MLPTLLYYHPRLVYHCRHSNTPVQREGEFTNWKSLSNITVSLPVSSVVQQREIVLGTTAMENYTMQCAFLRARKLLNSDQCTNQQQKQFFGNLFSCFQHVTTPAATSGNVRFSIGLPQKLMLRSFQFCVSTRGVLVQFWHSISQLYPYDIAF